MGGGRINFHGIYPVDTFVNRKYYVLLEGDLMKASSRLALVNYIVTEPLDCPVAVIFGHSCAMNWAGSGFDDVGVDLANSFWKAGYYADLIPTSEIYNGSLQMLDDGTIQYGAQTYKAAVLYHPEFERVEFADFFNPHSGKATALYRIGDWTMDFSAKPVDGNSALPKTIISCSSNDECTKQVIEFLKSKNIESYTPAITLDYQNGDHYVVSKFRYKHLMPPTSGHVKYIDGTHAYFAGDTDVMGDPIHKTVEIDDQILEFDAVGVFAIRFDEQGQVEALAAGGLKSVKTGDFDLTLDQRVDLALWMDSSGQWHGYTLGMEGTVPQALLEFTTDWQRQAFPEPLDYTLSK
jgi:hypothetical protein